MKKLLAACFGAALMVGSAAQAADDKVAFGAIQSKNWTEAEAQLRAGLQAEPNDPMKLLNLAYVLQNTGRKAEANDVYQQVLTLNRDPLVAIGPDDNVKSARAKIVAKKGMASLESK